MLTYSPCSRYSASHHCGRSRPSASGGNRSSRLPCATWTACSTPHSVGPGLANSWWLMLACGPWSWVHLLSDLVIACLPQIVERCQSIACLSYYRAYERGRSLELKVRQAENLLLQSTETLTIPAVCSLCSYCSAPEYCKVPLCLCHLSACSAAWQSASGNLSDVYCPGLCAGG